MILETERLVLRELSREDFSDLYDVLADPDVTAHYPYSFDEDRVKNWIERNIARYKNDGFGLWAVIHKESGRMIGDCGITMQKIEGEMLPEIGYHIHKDFRRKGYASEAAAGCIEYAFSKLGFERLYSYMKYTNEPSCRTAEKNGMTFLKEYPDPDNKITKVYSISNEEWKMHKKSVSDRYHDIKKRLLDIAEQDDEMTAVIAIGSSVRKNSCADEYSDIDLVIAVKDTEKWLYGDIPSKLGEVMISLVEPTLGGGMERRILFNGSLDADIIIFTPEQLENAVFSGAANEVMNRGYSVMYDSMNITGLLEKHIVSSVREIEMSEAEFVNRVEDFWFHTVWASKKILRGELWTAKMCIDAYLKNHLLSVIELNRSLTEKTDVWHCGRFFEKWAGEENTEQLKSCFAHYDREDMISALKCTAALFGENAHSAAKAGGFDYPEKAEKYALELINYYFKK